jgi:choline dehydrogenase-like flavoprotein
MMLTICPQIFVVDASVFPGMVTTNPSSLIMAVAERASLESHLGSCSNRLRGFFHELLK